VIDGEVVEGMFVVDVSMFIGEFVLVEVGLGDVVVGVMVNVGGWIVVWVIWVGVDI